MHGLNNGNGYVFFWVCWEDVRVAGEVKLTEEMKKEWQGGQVYSLWQSEKMHHKKSMYKKYSVLLVQLKEQQSP